MWFLHCHSPSSSSTGSDIKTDGFSMETCRVMVNLMDVSFQCLHGFATFSHPDNKLSLVRLVSFFFFVTLPQLGPPQNSTDGRLGLGEFATLWKKVQRYLVRPG